MDADHHRCCRLGWCFVCRRGWRSGLGEPGRPSHGATVLWRPRRHPGGLRGQDVLLQQGRRGAQLGRVHQRGRGLCGGPCLLRGRPLHRQQRGPAFSPQGQGQMARSPRGEGQGWSEGAEWIGWDGGVKGERRPGVSRGYRGFRRLPPLWHHHCGTGLPPQDTNLLPLCRGPGTGRCRGALAHLDADMGHAASPAPLNRWRRTTAA